MVMENLQVHMARSFYWTRIHKAILTTLKTMLHQKGLLMLLRRNSKRHWMKISTIKKEIVLENSKWQIQIQKWQWTNEKLSSLPRLDSYRRTSDLRKAWFNFTLHKSTSWQSKIQNKSTLFNNRRREFHSSSAVLMGWKLNLQLYHLT